MSYSDFSANFYYTGQPQNFIKPFGVSVITFEVYGGGGGGSVVASGGAGAYVLSKYNFLQESSYNIIINVGSGGQGQPTLLGGISVGGILDPSGIVQTNGGYGTTFSGSSSAGGGGASSVLYSDSFGNRFIKIIAGGGGGGGSLIGNNGGASGNIGLPVFDVSINKTVFSSVGNNGSPTISGGQGGNSTFYGNAGIGSIYGGVNGFDYNDASTNLVPATFIGGGGGNGGTFSGGGGGAGYGGAASGYFGGGGGGGSFSNGNINSFILGGGGQGGAAGGWVNGGGVGGDGAIFIPSVATLNGGGEGGPPYAAGQDGFIKVSWNNKQPTTPAIVGEYMLNSQHTSGSIYTTPLVKPTSVKTVKIPSGNKLQHGVIGANLQLYNITEDGVLFTINRDFQLQWTFSAPLNYSFFGTPVIVPDGTLYISSTTTSTIGQFYSIIDDDITGTIKWSYPLIELNDSPSTSPLLDLSSNIYFGSKLGYIYGISDAASNAILMFYFNSFQDYISDWSITGLVFDLSYTRICFTQKEFINVCDVSNNTLLWQANSYNNNPYNVPSFGNDTIYVTDKSSLGFVYAYDISGGIEKWNRVIDYTNLSNIAIGSDDYIYFTTSNALYRLNSSGYSRWTFPIEGEYNTYNSDPVIDANNNVIFGASDSYLYSINASERLFNWRYPLQLNGATQAMPIIGKNGNIYIPTHDLMYDISGGGVVPPTTVPISPMYMLNTQHTGITPYYGPTTTNPPNNILSADFVSGNLFVSPSIAIDSSGMLYIGSNDGYLYNYDPSGNFIWKLLLNEAQISLTSPNSMYTTPLIGPDGTIYIGSNEGFMYAVDPSGPTIKWKYNAGYPLQSSPIMDASGFIFFGAGYNMHAIGDAGHTAYKKWNLPFPTNGHINSSPALGQNGFIYFGSDDGFVYAVDRDIGGFQWLFDASANATAGLPDGSAVHPIYTSAAIDPDNNVIIGSGSYMNGVLYSLDGTTGSLNWKRSSIDWYTDPTIIDTQIGPFYNTVAIKDDTIYLSTIAYVYAINRFNGLMIWKYSNTNFYYSSPIIDASGTLFFTSISAAQNSTNNGILHSITDKGYNGGYVPNWSVQVSSPGRLAPPVLGNNRRIYLTGTSDKVYAVY